MAPLLLKLLLLYSSSQEKPARTRISHLKTPTAALPAPSPQFVLLTVSFKAHEISSLIPKGSASNSPGKSPGVSSARVPPALEPWCCGSARASLSPRGRAWAPHSWNSVLTGTGATPSCLLRAELGGCSRAASVGTLLLFQTKPSLLPARCR